MRWQLISARVRIRQTAEFGDGASRPSRLPGATDFERLPRTQPSGDRRLDHDIQYPSVCADTSYREREILGDGDLDPEWRAVILRHADRLMVGTDTWINVQRDDYEGLIALNRRWLAKLPRDVAERIAYRNAARLFGRDVSNDLIGTR